MSRETQLTQIKIMAELLDDLEQTRKTTKNRIRASEAILETAPEIAIASQVIEDAEKQFVRFLEKMWRHHMLAEWTKGVAGAGDKTVARLIAEIGEPSLRALGHIEEIPSVNGGGPTRIFTVDSYEERTAAELLSYCGHGDPTRRPFKNMTQEEMFRLGNPRAKMRTHLVAEALMKRKCTPCMSADFERRAAEKTSKVGWAAPPEECCCKESGLTFRVVYDQRRSKTMNKTHESVCVRCGPSGSPAPVGSPWSNAHKHADALRVTGKKFLVALWQESRRQRGL